MGCSHTWIFLRCVPTLGKLSLILNTSLQAPLPIFGKSTFRLAGFGCGARLTLLLPLFIWLELTPPQVGQVGD